MQITTNLGISNYDHTIDPGLEDLLKNKKNAVAGYAGYYFYGYVWYDRNKNKFTCEVWQFHRAVKRIYSKTLKETMTKVSDEFGWE